MNPPIIYEITPDIEDQAVKLCKLRFEQKRILGVSKIRQDGTEYNFKDERTGLIAEIVVSKFLGCSIDTSFYKYGDSHKSDLNLPISIEIKGTATSKEDCKLIMKDLKELKSRFLILVRVRERAEILGWTFDNIFTDIMNYSKIDPSSKKLYWVPRSELYDMSYLKKYINGIHLMRLGII